MQSGISFDSPGDACLACGAEQDKIHEVVIEQHANKSQRSARTDPLHSIRVPGFVRGQMDFGAEVISLFRRHIRYETPDDTLLGYLQDGVSVRQYDSNGRVGYGSSSLPVQQ